MNRITIIAAGGCFLLLVGLIMNLEHVRDTQAALIFMQDVQISGLRNDALRRDKNVHTAAANLRFWVDNEKQETDLEAKLQNELQNLDTAINQYSQQLNQLSNETSQRRISADGAIDLAEQERKSLDEYAVAAASVDTAELKLADFFDRIYGASTTEPYRRLVTNVYALRQTEYADYHHSVQAVIETLSKQNAGDTDASMSEAEIFERRGEGDEAQTLSLGRNLRSVLENNERRFHDDVRRAKTPI